MLSVLPPPCEDPAWGPCPGERKRPAAPSCLGEYHSVSGRAKRLRQELLRLRQWEQQVHQESTGAREGQADSCDDSFTVEPPASSRGPLLSRELRHSQFCGAASCLEDACDSTASPVHGLPLAGAPDACRCPYPSELPDPVPEQPHASHASLQRQAASNPTELRRSASPMAVQNGKTLSLPPRLALAAASQPSAATPETQTPAARPQHSGRPLAGRSPQGQGGPTSHGADPPLGLWAASTSEGASVQQSEPQCGRGAGAAWGGSRGPADEEDSLREETSPPLLRLPLGMAGALGATRAPLHTSDKAAAAAGCLALPPLPRQYLGMPTATRLRLLEFFLQAAELLGLELPSLHLAAVMLDCCWVEEGMRVKRAGSGAHSVLSYEAEAGPLPSLSGENLQVTALACLLHAFRCVAAPSTSSAEAFVRRLSAGSSRAPRVAAMLPVRAGALEECLKSLARRMPPGWASSATSSSGLLWPMVELRFGGSQKQHLGLFVAHLCALGYQRLPPAVLAAATACLPTAGVPRGCSADHAAHSVGWRAACPGLEEKHLEVLQDFLCCGTKGSMIGELGAESPGQCVPVEEQCVPEPSEEISI